MSSRLSIVCAALVTGFILTAGPFACQSTKEPGVTSSYHSQWSSVSADTRTTTEAARAVLQEQGLRDVRADATNVDGTASAKKADGTEVKISVRKKGENLSEVTTTVGTVGDPTLGAEIVRRIKDRVEGNAARPAGSNR
jgi:Protein of unknown function (DUF3568)